MLHTAERLFGDTFMWLILAADRHQMGFCTMGAFMRGNVPVGLEGSLYLGQLAGGDLRADVTVTSVRFDLAARRPPEIDAESHQRSLAPIAS